MTDPTPSPAWLDLAGRALIHSYAGRFDIAIKCVERLGEQHGPDVIPQVLLAWVDASWAQAFPDGLPDGYLSKPMSFWHEGDDHTEDVDSVPPPVRWAGRFIFARLTDDQVQAEALLNAVPSEVEWGRVVAATLDVCGANMRLAQAHRLAAGQ